MSESKKIEAVFTAKAPKPLPQFSQAVKFNGMVYCSGNIGLDPETGAQVEGTVTDREGELRLTEDDRRLTIGGRRRRLRGEGAEDD